MEPKCENMPKESTTKKEYVKPECETHKPLDHVGFTYYTYTYYYY